MELFERKTYSMPEGMDDALKEFANKYPQLWDNKSHVVRCAVIAFLRQQRKEGRFISEVLK